jgi:hypothetical protein
MQPARLPEHSLQTPYAKWPEACDVSSFSDSRFQILDITRLQKLAPIRDFHGSWDAPSTGFRCREPVSLRRIAYPIWGGVDQLLYTCRRAAFSRGSRSDSGWPIERNREERSEVRDGEGCINMLIHSDFQCLRQMIEQRWTKLRWEPLNGAFPGRS